MKDLLNSITNRLKTVSELRYVGENEGQLQEERPPVQFPCALIEVENISWSHVGELHQKGSCELTITVANLKLGNTSANAPQNQKDAGWYIHEVISKVNQALHGWIPEPEGSSMLTRKTLKNQGFRNGIQEYSLSYDLMINDDLEEKYSIEKDVKPLIKTGFIPPR